ncbi:MAG: oligoendopeptidase F [Eggerthellaceae bacterium]
MAYESRDQIPVRYTWDLSSIYPNDEAFLAALEKAQEYPARLESYQGKIAQDPEQLLALLKLDDEVGIAMGKLVNYAQRKSDEDTRNSTYQDYASRVMTLYTEVASAESWFAPELMRIDDATMTRFYEQVPGLVPYRRNLDLVFSRRAHTLSPSEEQLLAKASDLASQPENIYSLFADANLAFADAHDSQGKAHPVTHGTFIPLMMSPDRSLRESAYKSMYAAYGQFRDTCAATLAAQMKTQHFYAEARRYPDTLTWALEQNEIPTAVYLNLIKAVHRNLPALHKYLSLRKRILGVEELRFWDVYVPLAKDVEPAFTYEEACTLILRALEPMGKDYCAIVKKGLSERWVDVYETPGKRSGAYSAGGYGMHPVICMNFQGKLDDVFTLIHEMGHSVHTYLSCENQPPAYADYTIFVAEVASTCNEALLTRYLLSHTEDTGLRSYVLNHFLEQFRGTLYRQCLFAEFELKVNELCADGKGITADSLCALYRQLKADYFGPEITVDDGIALEWARIPHFYYGYYVYQYATGFAAAIALSRRIIEEGQPAVEDYLGFLSGGSSKPPIELLRGAGVDMATPAPIDAALEWFDILVDELTAVLE